MSLWENVPDKAPLPDGVVDAVVVGGGPAAYTAAIYLARAKMEPVVLESAEPGGLLKDAGIVENYPGFPEGIEGPELMARIRTHAEAAGATLRSVEATGLRLSLTVDGGGPVHEVDTPDGTLRTRTVVLATGAEPRRLALPGESELSAGRGVAYCAVCEAPLFAGKTVAVVGGGDSAMEEALALARHAHHVTLIHRGSDFRCAPLMLERVQSTENITIISSTVVTALLTGPDGTLRAAGIAATDGSADRELQLDGLFVAIGHTPRSELVHRSLECTASGHVRSAEIGGATTQPGVFAAGDVSDDRFRQAITAAGAGCAAALEAERYLGELRSRHAMTAGAGAPETQNGVLA